MAKESMWSLTNQQIYLNHKLLEKKELNLAEIQQKSAEFLMQFSGVNEAYSANRLSPGFMDTGNIQKYATATTANVRATS